MSKAKTKVDYLANRKFHTLTATLFCWACIFLLGPLLGILLHPVEKFNPLSRWQDVQLSDLYFSYFSASKRFDSNIVIMDCSILNRDGIATQIESAVDNGATVVGVDVQFHEEADTTGTVRLQEVLIRQTAHVVLALDHVDTGVNKMNQPFYQGLMTETNPLPRFGYLVRTNANNVMRDFTPIIRSRYTDEADTSFEIKIMEVFGGKDALKKLYARGKKNEIVHYRKLYNYQNEVLPRYGILYPGMAITPGSLNGKIVLIGDYNSSSFEDYHFSPMNESLQRSYPDLKGVEYHAQVLSMLQNGDYISVLWFKKLWVFIFCAMGVYFFLKILHQPLFHIWLDLIVLLLSPIIMIISILLLKYMHLKLEPAEFIIPLFFTGILLHLYDWLVNKKWLHTLINKIIKDKKV